MKCIIEIDNIADMLQYKVKVVKSIKQLYSGQ